MTPAGGQRFEVSLQRTSEASLLLQRARLRVLRIQLQHALDGGREVRVLQSQLVKRIPS